MVTLMEFHGYLCRRLTRIKPMFLPCRNQEGNQEDNQEGNQAINQGTTCYQNGIGNTVRYRVHPLGEPTRRPVRNRRSRPAP